MVIGETSWAVSYVNFVVSATIGMSASLLQAIIKNTYTAITDKALKSLIFIIVIYKLFNKQKGVF